jgi:hypothetical protein
MRVVGALAVGVIALLWFTRTEQKPGALPAPASGNAEGRSERVARELQELSGQRDAQGAWSTSPQDGGHASHKRAPKLASAANPNDQVAAKPPKMHAHGDGAGGSIDADNAKEFETLTQTVLSSPDAEARADALSTIHTYDEEMVLPVLAKALLDREPEVRLAAIHELWLTADDPPLYLVESALRDSDPEVRLEALKIASESEDDGAKKLIEQARSDPDEDVRSDAEFYAGGESDEP